MQPLRTVFWFAFLALGYAPNEVPLSAKKLPNESRDALAYRFNIQAAENALATGLPAIAKDLFQEALASKLSLNDGHKRNKLRLGLASALIASGNVAEADKQLDLLTPPASNGPEAKLRRAMIAFLQRDLDNLKKLAPLLDGAKMENAEKDWAAFLQSMASFPGEESNAHFAKALELSGNADRRTEFKLFRIKEELLQTGGSEVLAANLKRQMEEFRGKEAAKEFSIQYVMVLHAIGKQKEALKVLEKQLKANGNKPGNWRDRLLLLYGMMGDFSDTGTRSALETLIENGSNREYQEIGLRILTSQDAGKSKNGEFLDRLLGLPQTALTADLLSTRLRLALEQNEHQTAENTARRIMEEFPASPRKPEAIRALAAAAHRSNPPKYLLVADLLSRLREFAAGQPERDALEVQIADCRFLAKDYSGAAALYLELKKETENPALQARALYQAINSLLFIDDLNGSLSLIRDFPHSVEAREYRWSAEWNMILHLKERNREGQAISRINSLLKIEEQFIPSSTKMHLLWLKAALTLRAGDAESAKNLANETLNLLAVDTNATLDAKRALASKIQLTKGRALFVLKDKKEADETFKLLRTKHPSSDETAFSYLVEANHHAADNRLDEAQRSLLSLADQHKNSLYAPIALYEASIHLERRGLDKNLKEGIDLLERLTKDYPEDRLVFYARQRQANLLRRRNEFGPALELCEDLLATDRFRSHPARHSVMLIRADCILALARNQRQKLIEASEAYAELKRMADKPMSFRSEAAYKQGVALRRMGKSAEAEKVYFRDVELALLMELREASNEEASGRYWLARSLLDFGEMLELGDRANQAKVTYRKILAHGLPGSQLATSRINAIEGADDTEQKP